MQSYDLIPAFSDPVADSQQVFRVLLTALSEPGIAHTLATAEPLAELSPAAYSIALTLLDSSTAVWLSPALASDPIRQNLAFHTGCAFVDQPEAAQFAFLTEAETEVLAYLNVGTDRDPEFSCTAIVQKTALEGETEQVWSGPGIEIQRLVKLDLSPQFWQLRTQKNQFPRGLDVLLVAQDRVLGLPRTTQVQLGTEG